MRDAAGERVALQPVARLEQPRRDAARPPVVATDAALDLDVIPSRSFASRQASCRCGDSGSASRICCTRA